MHPRTKAKLRRYRLPPTEEERQAALAPVQQQQHQQQVPLWQRLPGLPPPPNSQVLAPASALQAQLTGIMHGQGQGPSERWEQVPTGIQLMNEICDAISIGSDFAFWGKSKRSGWSYVC